MELCHLKSSIGVLLLDSQQNVEYGKSAFCSLVKATGSKDNSIPFQIIVSSWNGTVLLAGDHAKLWHLQIVGSKFWRTLPDPTYETHS